MDMVAHDLGLDPVEVRKRNYIKADEMPYETPNGCIYDSGDYAKMLDTALELIGYDDLAGRRAEAAARGRLLGVGIGSTLDSGTNNFGQSRLINPELQFSGNNEVATVKLDILGEIVVTLGTTPQGQGHETTAAQVVADILGCSIDDVNVRAGHDSYWNSHAGFSGTYASQFAVTGLGAVKGATEMLAGQMKKLASVVLGCAPEDIELAEGQARMKENPEAALPFMALGAIINANNAGLPEDLDVTLNCRYVYRPPFEVPDVERKFGNLTLTYAAQIHAAVVEIDPETGYYEIVDYAAVDDCGLRIHPQIVEGQVMGATAQALGAAVHESFEYDEEGNLLTPNFYDYHVPHALDMPPMRNGFIESESPFTPLGAKGMGEGGGAGIHAVCAALQDALGKTVTRSCNPYHRVWELLRSERGGTAMHWEADVRIAGPVGSMGQRVLQPIVNQQVSHVLTALEQQVQEAAGGGEEAPSSGSAGTPEPTTDPEPKDSGPPAEGPADPEGTSGAEEGLNPWAPESYEPEPEGPKSSTEDREPS